MKFSVGISQHLIFLKLTDWGHNDSNQDLKRQYSYNLDDSRHSQRECLHGLSAIHHCK